MQSAAPTIAILDDEAEMRKALRRLLACGGFVVVEYPDGRRLLEALDSHPCHCLLLDLHMPEINGFDVLQALRDRHSTVPVIVITAHDEPGTPGRVLGLGACACLRKPVEKSTLLEAVRRVCPLPDPTASIAREPGPPPLNPLLP